MTMKKKITEKEYEKAIAVIKQYNAQFISDVQRKKEEMRLALITTSTPIEDLDMSVRLYNLLKWNGRHDVGDLMALTPNEFYSFRNAGRKSLLELMSVALDNNILLSAEFQRFQTKK